MNLASILKSLARPNAESAASLQKAMASIDVQALEDVVSDLERDRKRLLLSATATNADIAKIDERIRSAEIEAERGIEAKKELTKRIEVAEAREADAALTARRSEADRLNTVAIAALQTNLPAAYGAVRAVLRTVLEAQAAVAAVNGDLPPDQRLPDIEEWRQAAGSMAELELNREKVDLWCYSTSGEPLDERSAAQVRDGGSGSGILSSGSLVPATQVVRRKFIRTTRLPAVQVSTEGTLAQTLVLPAIRASETPGWTPPRYSVDPAELLAELDRLEREFGAGLPDERRPVVQLEPVESYAPPPVAGSWGRPELGGRAA